MNPKFAKGIAANLRIIAEHTALLAVQEIVRKQLGADAVDTDPQTHRDAVSKAESNIAAFLQQPGSGL